MGKAARKVVPHGPSRCDSDPSQGKTLGRKVLSDEEKRRLKNGEDINIDRVVTPVDDLDEAAEGEEKLIGRNVKPEVNQRVKFRRALNQKSDEKRWVEAEGRPGTIIEVTDEFPSVR